VIPDGMHDVLPLEAAELCVLETALRERFVAYGYGEVRTPTLEYAETLERAEDTVLEAGYRLYDGSGVLSLRTDMTLPVARLAVERLRDRPLPLRLSYVADSFRQVAPRRGEEGAVTQAGVELLGLESPVADAECVIVLCDALAAAGLSGYRVTLGSVAFHRELVAAFGLSHDDADDVFDALAARDYPLLESIVAKSTVDDEGRRSLQRALELSGGDSALAEARRLASTDGMKAAVERLVAVRDLADDAGFGDVVGFDFGLFQDLSYYTGIVIEAYAPGVGLPIASGGRYDDLLGMFGWDLPAVGFAISLDRLHLARCERGAPPIVTAASPLAFVGGLEDVEKATELRRAGVAVTGLPAADRHPGAPSLMRDDGDYVLVAADGQTTRGSWRDILRALGVS